MDRDGVIEREKNPAGTWVLASDYDALLAEVDRLREWQRKMIDAVNSGKIYLIHALIEETDHDNRQ
jgi:hypothetical protein